MNVLILLILLSLALWYWQDSLRAREQARAASATACRRCGVQLLDDTVALERLWPSKDRAGHWHLERLYFFEFTDTGMERRTGSVLLLGRQVAALQMEGNDFIML